MADTLVSKTSATKMACEFNSRLSDQIFMYDAEFHAFGILSKLVDKFLQKRQQLTKEQAEAIHESAKQLAKDLTSGEYS